MVGGKVFDFFSGIFEQKWRISQIKEGQEMNK